MMASALLRNGPGHVNRVLATVETWLLDHGYESVTQMQGSMSMAGAPNPDAFVRSNYMKMLASYSPAE
jgi:dihydroorotate dehydrogenase (fumarate)